VIKILAIAYVDIIKIFNMCVYKIIFTSQRKYFALAKDLSKMLTTA